MLEKIKIQGQQADEWLSRARGQERSTMCHAGDWALLWDILCHRQVTLAQTHRSLPHKEGTPVHANIEPFRRSRSPRMEGRLWPGNRTVLQMRKTTSPERAGGPRRWPGQLRKRADSLRQKANGPSGNTARYWTTSFATEVQVNGSEPPVGEYARRGIEWIHGRCWEPVFPVRTVGSYR